MPKKLVFLKTEEDFSNFKRSKSLDSANLRIRWHQPLNQNAPRFGFIVPKKTMKRVTDRNLIKRRIKAVLQKNIGNLNSVDILFFPKPASIKLKFGEFQDEVLGMLKKAKIYEDHNGN